MDKPLVSIVTPCYNGEKFIDRYFKSILNQSYDNIQLIFVDDGSEDKTNQIVERYKSLLEERNIDFTYIYQDNAGQAAALNKGLPLIKGDFLVWPDSDDYYEPSAIQDMVEFLIDNPDIDYVRCGAQLRNEDNIELIEKILEPKEKNKQDLFENYVFVNDIHYFPGVIMIRMKHFDSVNKKRKIYESRGGQNWQMILPIAYNSKAGYIDKILYNAVARVNSHSRMKHDSLEKEIEKINNYEDILKNVLMEMNLYNKYFDYLFNEYNLQRMLSSLVYKDYENAKHYANLITNKTNFSISEKLKIIISKNIILFYMFEILRKIKNVVKRNK